MTDELKPVRCGCGGEAKVQRVKTLKSHVLVVMCTKCEIATNYYTKEAEAITAWNKAMGAKDINVPTKSVENIYSVGDHDKIYVYGFCPECGSAVIKPDKYCSECGCRLEWK